MTMDEYWTHRAEVIANAMLNAHALPTCKGLDGWAVRIEVVKAFDRLHGEHRQLVAPLYLPNAWRHTEKLKAARARKRVQEIRR